MMFAEGISIDILSGGVSKPGLIKLLCAYFAKLRLQE